MRKQFRNIRQTLKRVGFYIPFTWYFVLFAVAGFAGYEFLKSKSNVPDSAFTAIFALLLHIAIVFGMIILGFALLSVLVSYLFFSIKKRKSGINFNTDAELKANTKKSKQAVHIHIHPILAPFLGFVKVRLKYDNTRFSEKFQLIKRSQKKIISTTIDGTYHWLLPEIKEYRIEKAIIYFEDFFQFFSFAVAVKTNNSFHTQPVHQNAQQLNVFPRKTEETTTRIEEIKKVEGEYLNYKNFEQNDDVRRIVWKIYAKNKELVVRIPEILDPYASHIYLYASFFSSYDVKGNEVVEIPFLNYYKTIIWSVYKQLAQKGFEVRYVPDQEIPQKNSVDQEEQIKYTVSVSAWQTNKEIKEYVKPKDASVVIISSLSDIVQVQEMLDNYGNDISFVFVPITESLNKQHLGHWLQWLFVQQEKDVIAGYKTNWSLSLLRSKVLQNEKQLKKLLEGYQKSTVLQKI